MNGVYRALRSHGYADVTMQDIADECSKSKSLLHYHYDTKEDLLVAFIDEVLTDSAARIREHADDPPAERLVGFIGWFVFEVDAVDREAFHIALLELRTQGPFNERIREQLVRSDRLLRGTVADILESGIEDGVFRDVDVEETAALIVATLDGARTRQITLTDGVGANDADDAEERDPNGAHEAESVDGSDATPPDEGLPEPTYTRFVAEAVLRQIVQPLLTDDAELPPLESGLGVLTRDDRIE